MKQHGLDFIIRHCQEEARQKHIKESGYCFELFRRAVDEDEELAWSAIQAQYRGLVIQWLQKAARGTLSLDDRDEMIQEGFLKFWLALKKRPSPLSDHFDHVGALLSYLNQCMVTTCLDFYRREHRRQKLKEKMSQEFHHRSQAQAQIGPQKLLEQKLETYGRAEQVERIRAWMRQEIHDPAEKLLLQLIYEEGLKPSQITERYPNVFPTYRDLHRVRVRVLKRAQRALRN